MSAARADASPPSLDAAAPGSAPAPPGGRRGRVVAAVQGAYFAATGVWPLLHLPSFFAVTGPKTDVWLVHTVAVLVLAIGGALLLAAVRARIDAGVRTLGAASAFALLVVETAYALRGTIRAVYLLDAAVEAVFVVAWMRSAARRRASG
jgi:hypothetical protein